jgi:hypothetical protein
LDGSAGRHPAADLVEVQAVPAVQHGQVHDHSGLHVQVVQQRRRGRPDLAVAIVAAAHTHRSTAEAVTEAGVIHPVQAHQLVEDAVHGRSRQPGPARHFLQGQAAGAAVERVEDQRHPFHHRRRHLLLHGRYRRCIA